MTCLTVDYLAARLRTTFEGDERDYWDGMIDAATVRLTARLKQRGCDITKIPPKLVREVLIDALARVWRLPDGYGVMKSETEGNYSYTLDATAASANIWFTDTELAMLCPGRRNVGLIKVGLLQRDARFR